MTPVQFADKKVREAADDANLNEVRALAMRKLRLTPSQEGYAETFAHHFKANLAAVRFWIADAKPDTLIAPAKNRDNFFKWAF